MLPRYDIIRGKKYVMFVFKYTKIIFELWQNNKESFFLKNESYTKNNLNKFMERGTDHKVDRRLNVRF